jgi:hypothetical protein
MAVMESSDPAEVAPSLWLQLRSRLRGHGHLWHRTSLPSLAGILRDGEIVPNTGQLSATFRESECSYGRHLGAVSLFDFDSSDESYIIYQQSIWVNVLTQYPYATVLICIHRDALDRSKLILPTEVKPLDPEGRTYMPGVEALHIGRIPVSNLSMLTLLEVGKQWYEAMPDCNAVRILTERSTELTSEMKRQEEISGCQDAATLLSGELCGISGLLSAVAHVNQDDPDGPDPIQSDSQR